MYSKLFYFLPVVSVLLILYVVRNGRFGNEEFPKTKDYSRSAMYNKCFPTYESACCFLEKRWNLSGLDSFDLFLADYLFTRKIINDSLYEFLDWLHNSSAHVPDEPIQLEFDF